MAILSFGVVSHLHKHKGTRLLSPQIEYVQVVSQIAERLKTSNLWKGRKFRKISKSSADIA